MEKIIKTTFQKRKKHQDVFCGVYIPEDTLIYIRLYGLFYGKTISQVVRTAIGIFIAKGSMMSTPVLLKELTTTYQLEWEKRKRFSENQKVFTNDFEKYKYQLKKELHKKNISAEYIDFILNKLKN